MVILGFDQTKKNGFKDPDEWKLPISFYFNYFLLSLGNLQKSRLQHFKKKIFCSHFKLHVSNLFALKLWDPTRWYISLFVRVMVKELTAFWSFGERDTHYPRSPLGSRRRWMLLPAKMVSGCLETFIYGK